MTPLHSFSSGRASGWLMLAALLLSAVPLQAAGEERIVLNRLEISDGVSVSRVDLEAAVRKGLAVAGRPVVADTDPDAASATYSVAGSAVRSGATFRVKLRLARVAGGAVINTEENQCDVADCSIAELMRRSARELVRQTLGRQETPIADAPPPPAPAAPTVLTTKVAAKDVPAWRRAPWPAVAAGTGALGIGVGLFLLKIDNDCQGSAPCPRLWNTRPFGIAAIAAGAVLGAAGVYFLVVDRESSGGTSVAVRVGPDGVAASGRF